MRRRVVEYPQGGMFRGRELPRLMTMLCFLVVLGMMMYRSSDPNTWKWLAPAGEERKAEESGRRDGGARSRSPPSRSRRPSPPDRPTSTRMRPR